MACEEEDDDSCGCIHQHSSDCILYKGDDLECLEVESGDDLTTIIQAIDDAFCDFSPSGHTYVTTGTSGEIDVSTTTSGSVTTYTVSLSDTITDAIDDLETDVNTINSCLEDVVKNVTTNTTSNLIITETATSACGRTLNIDFYTPSGVIYDGIIHNDTNQNYTTASATTQTVKTFNWDYSARNDIQIGDKIILTVDGKIDDDNLITFEIYNTTSGSSRYTVAFRVDQSSVFQVIMEINVKTATTAKVTSTLKLTTGKGIGDDVGGFAGISSAGQNIATTVTALDFTNTALNVIVTNNAGTNSSGTEVFCVDVRKKI